MKDMHAISESQCIDCAKGISAIIFDDLIDSGPKSLPLLCGWRCASELHHEQRNAHVFLNGYWERSLPEKRTPPGLINRHQLYPFRYNIQAEKVVRPRPIAPGSAG